MGKKMKESLLRRGWVSVDAGERELGGLRSDQTIGSRRRIGSVPWLKKEAKLQTLFSIG